MDKLSEVFFQCHSAVVPGMIPLLAAELGVLPEAIEQLGVGYDYRCQAWVFAERDAKGDIIGLSYRYESGKKTMAPGLKHHRGLVYPLNPDYGKGVNHYANGAHNWARVADVGVNCPVCGKPDGCLVSADNPADPSAAICIRPVGKEGAAKDLGNAGCLHILKPQGKVQKGTVLPPTDLPILIVEGASDVLAAMSMGYVAIGRPSASAGMEILTRMPLAGKEVWIIGENDAGAGREGMEKTFAVVRTMTPSVKRVMPPEGIKDLRAWYNAGLNQEVLLAWVRDHAETSTEADSNVFENGQPTTFTREFIKHNFTAGNDTCVLRSFNSEWYAWGKDRYTRLPERDLRGAIIRFLDGKSHVKETAGGKIVVPIPMTRTTVMNVESALDALPSIQATPPAWLSKTDMPDPKDLIVFKNGILDVNEYMEGRIKLYPHDPDLFVLSTFPYDYDENASSPMAEDYFRQVLGGDRESIRLLQQWFGYNLVPDKSYEKMMVLIGRPRSGKGTTLDMLRGMLGPDLWCSASIGDLGERFGKHKMLNRHAVLMAEAKSSDRARMSAALEALLSIVGCDPVSIERKFRDDIAGVDLCCRFTMAMNINPEFSDHARALLPRLNIVRFPKTFAGHEDYQLKPRLEAEAKSGKLINWALSGLKDLRTRGKFVEPRASLQALKEFEETVTPMVSFLHECCTLRQDAKVLKRELFDVWKNWSVDNGHRIASSVMFSKRVMNACYEIRPTRLRDDGGERVQYYMGVALTDDARKRYLV